MQPAQNRKQFTKKKKKNVLLQQAKFLQGKNNSLDIFKQMQVCKLCWNVFCHAALCIGMYFAYPLCAFSVNKQPCGTHPKSALYFSFEINFRLVAVFESASDNEPTGARVAEALSRGRASAGADARRQRGPTARVPSANFALRLLSSDSSVAVWENFKTKSQPLV